MDRLRRRYRPLLVAGGVAAIVTAANASQGGYFSQSWGWIALAFLIPTTVLVILERASVPGRLRIAFAALMGSLGVWIALSSLWSISSSASVREVERMLVYVALALSVALIVRRRDTAAVLGGAALGVTLVCGYALATRLFPDRFDTFDDPIVTYRLAEPVGYWNALGLLAAMGVLLILGFAAHARPRAVSSVAAALLPVLATTLYFTFSRGAWAAFAVGLLATLALDPRRLRLAVCSLVVAAPAIACVAYASTQEALTTEGAAQMAAVREGHRVAVVLLLAVFASGLLGLGARIFAERVPASSRSRRVFDVALVALLLAAAVGGLIALGGPADARDKLESRFNSDSVSAADLNERLFSISGNGRSEQWQVSWDAGRDRPFAGHGAGTFEYIWYEQRPDLLVVRDGHSLYLETFAELGIVGLTLLGGALLVLVVGGVRGRRSRLVASGTAAFLAWAAASAIDWHWEMVGATLTALLVGAAGLLASERRRVAAPSSGARLSLVGVTATLSVFALWSLVGNQALFAARESIARKEWADARTHAERARDLLSWSYEPYIALGDAAAGAGDREAAVRAYRSAVAKDPDNWVAWLRLAQVETGAERAAAYDRVHELNPREENLPGE